VRRLAPPGTTRGVSENRRPPNILWCCAGELYDLQEDPHEHANLWDSPEPEHQARKLELMKRSFDATVQAMDYGPRRIMPS
jgi:hypothetical protein